MKNLIKRHVRLLALTLAFIMSGAIPANSQSIQYVDKNNHQAYSENSKADVSELEQPFYCRIDDNMFSFLEVPNNTTEDYVYTISKKPITITDAKYGNILEEDIIGNTSKSSNALTLRIDENEDSKILCYNNVDIDVNYKTISFTIAVHDMSLVEEQAATCTSDGYRKYRCNCCKEERTETLYALGHSYGEWQTMEGGHMRTCSHDANHKQYNMDATGVNALEITLTDDTKLSYPSTLSPVVTFNDLDVAIGFDTDKTSLVNKADIKEYNQVWSHNKKGYAQNEDKTYSHACDYTNCGYKHDDLFVKNGEQYYAAEKVGDVIKVADMTLNDSEGYDCEADITVGSVSYSRYMKDNQWGTLCLPFAINPSAYAEYCSFYQLNSVNSENSEIVLSRIDNQEIAAGTPVLVRRNAAVNGISISATDAAMSNAVLTGSTAEDYTLVGRLTTSDALTGNCYIINNDKFWNVDNLIKSGKATTVKVGAFRSYLVANTPLSQAMMFSLSIGGDDTTAIDVLNAADNSEAEIYDLNGHRLPDLQKGVNIVKRGNKTTKVIIK